MRRRIPTEQVEFVALRPVLRHCYNCKKITTQRQGYTEVDGQTYDAFFCEKCHQLVYTTLVLEN